MKTKKQPDAVDAILAQWNRERPDLDVTPMGTIGRIRRCSALLQRELDRVFADYGMSSWEFDVLATMRRSGAPHRLTPTALFSTLMITSGTMTHRLKSLESRGWVQRVPHDNDARSMLVELTQEGLDLINRAVEAHVDNEHRVMAALSAAEMTQLDAGLSRLLNSLEPPETDA
ncbi:MAG: MarR family transcriptional regulator [Burkholderiales bacterium]|nr:MarR family transcriptional regulator [Burkholderiales bacterium]